MLRFVHLSLILSSSKNFIISIAWLVRFFGHPSSITCPVLLELIRLIIENKKIWILDEPFTNLDSESIDVLVQTFEDHCKNDGSVIFSSHQVLQIRNLEEILL